MTEPMRLVVSNAMRIWGGGENWSLTVSRGLSQRGHSVFLVCQPDGELRRRALEEDRENLTVVPVSLRGDLNPLGILRMRSLFRRERIQLAVCNLDREVRTLGVAARLCGGVAFVRRRGSDYAFRNRLRYRLTYRHLVDRVLVNSESTRKTILEANDWMPPRKLHRIYNGIPVRDFFPSPESRGETRKRLGYGVDDFVVGMAGALLPRKRHLTLIRAVASSLEGVPGLRMLILGSERDPAYADLLRDTAAGLGVGGILDLHGEVSGMNSFYNAMDLFVMPSANEGFGYAAAEAMASGTTTVVSDASSLPEVAGESGSTGYVFPLDDHSALARIIGELASDPQKRKAVADAGRQRILTEFSLDRMVDETERFFGNLLAGDRDQ
jgi:glycosyltransferase involved in cell wall biosynthesis